MDKISKIKELLAEIYIDDEIATHNELKDIKLLINKIETKKMDKLCDFTHINNELEYAYDIIENTNVVVFEWTLNPEIPTKFVTNNIKQFGYKPDDFYYGDLKDYWDFVYHEDREYARENLYRARSLELNEFKHNYRIKTRTDEIRWIEERIIYERDEKGEVLSEKGILIDITEIKDLEGKLRNSKNRYANLFENSSAMIFTFDLRGNFINVNQKFLDVFNIDKSNINGMTFFQLFKADDINDKCEFINSIIKDTNKLQEFKVIDKFGKLLYLNVSINLIYEDNEPIEIECIALDITKKKIAEEKIMYLSFHDKLTDLYNRAFFDDYITKLNREKEYPFSLIIGDMNGLKEVNDLLGHKYGDKMLVKMADILRRTCRDGDIISRFGGDEFAILLRNIDSEGARHICDRIKEACKTEGNKLFKPSIALGYATKVDTHNTIEDLIKKADDNMYKNKLTESNSRRSSLITSLQTTLEEKTYETKEHASRMKDLAKKLGVELGLNQDKLDELSVASMLHDIGKIGVPDSILLKPSKLNDHEFNIIKKHSEIGFKILSSSDLTENIASYIMCHHERWDGSGYPNGLKGENIPIISRMIAIVDSYDAMTNDRPYKKAVGRLEAIKELRRVAGSQLDPVLVEEFIKIL